jgi:hypothetical protein
MNSHTEQVSLWLNNEYGLYQTAQEIIANALDHKKARAFEIAFEKHPVITDYVNWQRVDWQQLVDEFEEE